MTHVIRVIKHITHHLKKKSLNVTAYLNSILCAVYFKRY